VPEEYVTVVFNEIHQVSMTRAIYTHNQFEVVPYEMVPDWPGRMAAIIKCPEGKGQYQADRFTSFMYGSRVFDTLEGAQQHLNEY
jgi:hypothetical protein